MESALIITFEIISISDHVWKCHRSYIDTTSLTTEKKYVDPIDITMPGSYSLFDYGWSTDSFPRSDSLTPILGRGFYRITAPSANGFDTLIVDCYGTSFIFDAIVDYDYVGNNVGRIKYSRIM